jgi:protease I
MSKIAMMIDDNFEDSEFRVPYEQLTAAGHTVEVIGLEANRQVLGKRGARVEIERSVADVSDRDYDALVIPGGYSPDHLRTSIEAVRLTRAMALADKPVAAVCHGPWMLIEADVIDGRSVTSWPSLRTDLINAGARWLNRDVVVDGNLITSRKPEDLTAFSRAILHELDAGVPSRAEPVVAPATVSDPRPQA